MPARRRIRPVFFLGALSFLFLNASWLLSHFRADQLGWIADSWALILDSNTGIVRFTFSTDPNELGRMHFQAGGGPIHFVNWPSSIAADFTTWQILGFDYENDGRVRRLTVPYYALSLLSGLFVLWAGMRSFRKHATPPGTCPACGYDLRATPDRCPECGRVVPSDDAPAEQLEKEAHEPKDA